MTTPRFFALLLILVAGATAFFLAPTGSNDKEGPEGRDGTELSRGDRNEGERGAAEGLERSATGTALQDEVDPLVALGVARRAEERDADLEAREIVVTVRWPDDARPGVAPLAVAFDYPLTGVGAISALQWGLPTGTAPAEVLSERILGDINEDDSVPAKRRVVASAPLEDDGSGNWGARLQVPVRDGRIFIAAVGGGFWTPELCTASASDGSAELVMARGGQVAVSVERGSGADAAELGKTLVRVLEPSDMLQQASRARSGRGAFGAAFLADASGAAPMLTVPADLELEVRSEHEDAAVTRPDPFRVSPGQTFEVRVRLSGGAQIGGRVLTAEGDSAGPGVEVLVVRPGRAFGLDDTVLRALETDSEGRFLASALDGEAFRVRAFKDGFLGATSETVRVAPNAAEPAEVELRLGAGRSISGNVVDAAGVGVQDVELRAIVSSTAIFGMGAMTAMNGPTSGTRSGADGTFALTGLGTGPYTVTAVDAEGQVLARADDVAVETEGLTLTARPPVEVRGVVVDENDAPVADLDLRLARVMDAQLGEVRLERRATRSAPDGTFRFEGVTTGAYDVWTRTETHAMAEPLRVRVADGAAPADIKLVAPRAARARGQVLGLDGIPIEGATVTRHDPDAPTLAQGNLPGLDAEPTTTDVDGRFVLLGIPAGETQLQARHAKHPNARTQVFTLAPAEEHDDLVIEMSNGGSIEGICFDDEGRPAEGRIINAVHVRQKGLDVDITGADGTFLLSGLEPGRWQVVATDPSKSMTNEAGDASMGEMLKNIRMSTVEVVEGETASVFLGSQAPEAVEVSGRVTQAGEPVNERFLAWFGGAESDSDVFKGASSDANGRYEVTLPGPGSYVIQCSRVGSQPDRGETLEYRALIPEGATTFEFDVELPGGRVEGRVVDVDGEPASGERVSLMPGGGSEIGGLLGRGYGEVVADSDGTFLFDTVRPGTYFVAAGGTPGFGERPDAPGRVLTGPIEVKDNGAVTGLELRLTPAGSIEVTVVDASGSPVENASLFCDRGDGAPIEQMSIAQTNALGQFTFHGLSAGQYSIGARQDNLAAVESSALTVRPGETEKVQLLVGAGTYLVVRPLVPDGVEPGDVRIQVLDDSGRDHARRLTADDVTRLFREGVGASRRRVGPVPPGRYRVLATAPGGISGKKQVVVDGSDKRDTVRVRMR